MSLPEKAVILFVHQRPHDQTNGLREQSWRNLEYKIREPLFPCLLGPSNLNHQAPFFSSSQETTYVCWSYFFRVLQSQVKKKKKMFYQSQCNSPLNIYEISRVFLTFLCFHIQRQTITITVSGCPDTTGKINPQ